MPLVWIRNGTAPVDIAIYIGRGTNGKVVVPVTDDAQTRCIGIRIRPVVDVDPVSGDQADTTTSIIHEYVSTDLICMDVTWYGFFI